VGNGRSRFDRLFEAEDFVKELTPELRAQEQRLRVEIERQRETLKERQAHASFRARHGGGAEDR
jgi:hypothetical protein